MHSSPITPRDRMPILSRRAFGRLCGYASIALGASLLAGCTSEPVSSSSPIAFDGDINDKLSATATPGSNAATSGIDGACDELLSTLSLEEKVAQLFVVSPEVLTGVEVVTQAGETTRAALSSTPVGGILYFGQNLTDSEQTRSMISNTVEAATAEGVIPLFYGVDEEGGTVSRIGGTPGFGADNVGDMADIGAAGDEQAAYDIAQTITGYLKPLGFNVDFAPDADIADNPDSFLIDRSFGSDAELVASMVGAEVRGFVDANMMCCAKHFPGMGSFAEDSHNEGVSSNDSLDDLLAQELVPFQAAIDAQVPFIMVGHLSLPTITGNDTPASLSPAIVNDILRDRLGYDGIVVTDGLGMAAITSLYNTGESAVMALEAGCDIPLLPNDLQEAIDAVLSAIDEGRLSEDRINESLRRILTAKLTYLPDQFDAEIQQMLG